MIDHTEPILTVAICTYQRLGPLKQTLHSLGECDPAGAPWELLVIDNAGDDQVEAIVDEIGRALPAPVRYVAEPALGTSHARNRAVREAAAPVIVFTDDDVTFDRAWLARIAATVTDHPDCEFWGGRVDPVWDQPAPSWFDPAFNPMLADTIVQYCRGDEPRVWDPANDPPFYTANLALRVRQVVEAGYFDTAVGHRGGSRMGMEDSLMVRAISERGGRGWYAADAVVHHPVTPDRISRRYARTFIKRQGWLSIEMLRRRSGPEARVPKWIYRAAAGEILRGLFGWLRGVITANPARAFGGELAALYGLTKLRHAVARPNTSRPG